MASSAHRSTSLSRSARRIVEETLRGWQDVLEQLSDALAGRQKAPVPVRVTYTPGRAAYGRRGRRAR